MNASTKPLADTAAEASSAPLDRVDARDAEMEDIVRLAGVGIEDVDTGDLAEASIVRSAGAYVIRIHRDAPCRAWALEHALAFLQCGHPDGIRNDTYQPSVKLDLITPPTNA